MSVGMEAVGASNLVFGAIGLMAVGVLDICSSFWRRVFSKFCQRGCGSED